ncbi:ABC-2 type transport system permease protein [Saccharopolyspora lacisalsi]|uniref:ABC-2 type transport system permease protein n=1 Tax=Halosaccharopolyspora lacisalsi TaxID=1000566 RepID=A0A839E4Q2_9PSEU|nr:hypothetical protein [Halosaccharopolyspora lacisalsi]MBA8826311.1 ABC-2 type transport system permease protein [Halosaccharopolyspora lacisalsi]
MAGVLIAMKLRVLSHSLRGGAQVVPLVLGAVFGLMLALVSLLSGLVEFVRPGAAVDLLSALFAVWLIGWVLGPLVSGGADDTLRAEHFKLLPIPPRGLALGLLAASFVGVPAVVTLLAFSGMVVYGAQLGGLPALVGAVFAVLLLFGVVLLSRVLLGAVGALMSSRRGRDLGIIMVTLLAFSGVAFNYAANTLAPAVIEGRATGLISVLHALPSGWGPVAVRAAAAGNWILVFGLGLGLVALIAVLLALYGKLLTRRTTVAVSSGSGPSRTESRRGALRGLLPDTPIGAVTGKELRLWWRDSRRRMMLITGVIIGVVIIVTPRMSAPESQSGGAGMLPYLALFVVAFCCLQAGNLYGFDGSAFWHTLSVPGAVRADVRGRQLAWLLVIGPLAVLLAVALPLITGSPGALVWMFGLLPVLLGAGSGLVLLMSVFAAFPMPDQRKNSNPLSAGGRPGCARGALQLAMGGLLVLVAVPPAALLIAGTVTDSALLRWLAVPVGLAVGAATSWWWGGLAINRLRARGPELLAEVGKTL